MPFGRILLPVCDARLLGPKRAAAAAVARPFSSRVDIAFLHASPDPAEPRSNPSFDETGAEYGALLWRHDAHRLDALRDAAGPDANLVELASEAAFEAELRTADLVVMGQPDAATGDTELQINKTALMASGRPVLSIARDHDPSRLLDHVLLAWDGGVQVARTVALSLPLLAAAARLTVYTSGIRAEAEHGQARLRDYLACNRIAADFVVEESGAARIAGHLDEVAAARGATLICMGAYGRGRTLQLLIGGNTRRLYKHGRTPLLFAA